MQVLSSLLVTFPSTFKQSLKNMKRLVKAVQILKCVK